MARRKVRSKRSTNAERGSGAGRWLLLAFVLAGAFLAYEYATLPDPAPLRTRNPRSTALIDQRAAEAREAGRKPRRQQSWVGISSVSKYGVAAVLLSEDAGFYQHDGVDVDQLGKALEDAWAQGRLGRGASTITQQLAKNLWLSTDRSLLRKAKELLLTRRLEEAMPKNRILTLYLNVAEWGDGVYGIEAAAREHFGIPASELSPAQASILAAMLPAPRKRAPTSGSPALRRRAHWIVDQLRYVRRITPGQVGEANAEIDSILGWSKGDAVAEDADDAEPARGSAQTEGGAPELATAARDSALRR